MSGRRCLQMFWCIWFVKKNYVKQGTHFNWPERSQTKDRESPLSSAISKCSWYWMEAIRQRFCMLQNQSFESLALHKQPENFYESKARGRISHCIGSPTIIRHWKIAPMTTTLSCEVASRSRCVLLGIGPFSKELL